MRLFSTFCLPFPVSGVSILFFLAALHSIRIVIQISLAERPAESGCHSPLASHSHLTWHLLTVCKSNQTRSAFFVVLLRVPRLHSVDFSYASVYICRFRCLQHVWRVSEDGSRERGENRINRLTLTVKASVSRIRRLGLRVHARRCHSSATQCIHRCSLWRAMKWKHLRRQDIKPKYHWYMDFLFILRVAKLLAEPSKQPLQSISARPIPPADQTDDAKMERENWSNNYRVNIRVEALASRIKRHSRVAGSGPNRMSAENEKKK